MNQTMKMKTMKPGPTVSVTFTDGMLVTADDLNAAMRYPLSVMQVLNRAYFGCGIVCGLDVKLKEQVQGAREVVVDPTGKEIEVERKGSFVIRIERGVALGCDGLPIELCEPVDLDLSPDKCGCPIEAGTVKFIAIRRVEAPEAPPRACGCGPSGGEEGQCSRSREHVLVEAFDKLPPGICGEAPAKQGESQHRHPDACECLKHCSSCDRCAEPWVLLATVKLEAKGVAEKGINNAADRPKHGGPIHIKPIACICGAEERWTALHDNYDNLLKRIVALEKPGPRGRQQAPEAKEAAAAEAKEAAAPEAAEPAKT